ncbi:MAG: NADH-quinone oxidoreductase subunit N, partial [Bdellovibrionia bacterium]
IKGREQNPLMSMIQATVGIFASTVCVALIWKLMGGGGAAFSDKIVVDGISAACQPIILFLTAGALFIAYENVNTRGDQFSEHVFLILNAAVGMLVLTWANDLLIVFIGLETLSLALYVLIAMSHEQRLSKEAAFKYFILGGFSTAIFMYGVAFLYGTTGTTSLIEIAQKTPALISTNKLFVIGFILVTVGFCFKVSIFPFHNWTPDVYQGAPTPVTSLMATAVKTAAFVAFLRFFINEGIQHSAMILNLLQWMAVATMLVGNLGAIMQDNLKRMLAYSSVAHSGYAFVALVVTVQGGYVSGSASLIFYLLTYAFMNLGAFGVIALFERHEETLVNVEDLKGLGQKRPALAAAFAIFMLSLAGLPPTAGFFGKFYVFSAAVSEGLIWLAVWGVLNSVISVYYYLRPIVVMYMTEGEAPEATRGDVLSKAAIAISAVLVVAIGIAAQPFFTAIHTSVMNVFEHL